MIRLSSVRKCRKQFSILNKKRREISLKYDEYIEDDRTNFFLDKAKRKK